MRIKTLLYDLIQLQSPVYRSMAQQNLPDMTHIQYPSISIPREQFIGWSNNYKILIEFVAEVLENKDFNALDLMNWYAKREHDEKEN